MSRLSLPAVEQGNCAARTANKRKHGAPSFDEDYSRRSIVFAVRLRRSMCAPPQENESFLSGSAHVVLGGKNNGVLTLNVMRHAPPPLD